MPVFYEKNKKYNCRVKNIPYFRTSVTINGKVHQVYGDGEKDAKQKVAALKEAANVGLNVDYSKSKLGTVMEYWLFNVKRVDKDIKASSFARYDSIYRTHIAPYPITNVLLSKLNSATVQNYVNSMYEDHNVTSSSIEGALKLWKMFMAWAIDEGYIIKNPCKNISIPGKYDKKKKEVEVFTEDERSQLLEYMSSTGYQYDTLIKLAFATGMRLGELLGLKWEDVKEDSIYVKQSTSVVTHVDKDGNRDRYREIWETKTRNSVRTIPLLAGTKNMLNAHKASQKKFFSSQHKKQPAFVFTTSSGQLLDPSTFSKSYRRLLKRANIPYRKFHAIRHTFGTTAIRRGVNVKDLQMLMGHSDIQTTYIYVHADEESKRSAIELMGDVM